MAAVIADEQDRAIKFTSTKGEYGGIAGLRGSSGGDDRRAATFVDVLERNNVPNRIHYFNLDVEGAEGEMSFTLLSSSSGFQYWVYMYIKQNLISHHVMRFRFLRFRDEKFPLGQIHVPNSDDRSALQGAQENAVQARVCLQV